MGDANPAAWRQREGRGSAGTSQANPSPGSGTPHPPGSAWSRWEQSLKRILTWELICCSLKSVAPFLPASVGAGTGSLSKLAAVITAGLLLLYILLCYEDFHFHVAHVYAHLGYPNAQHILGQRYLQGAGVEKNEDMAMHWFRQAAGQGHPHSSFNLAVGALRNMTVALEEGEVEKLLSVAAAHGLREAQQLLENILKSRNLH
ncbi:uncharacterized protein LOC115343928 [Aquila chrysaetos chrysaetos]|uniref:uncharacterized protein LOC115343928 n=1 Tax=Aquila chrysaetos chrysaetos TaxID=223781 RepID=UPI0011772D81|nr:uncharacterized protein LOC115343928 [Aquila chrysaetos chrysaetos]